MREYYANAMQADLPKQAQAYVKFVEEYTGVPVKWIGTGRKDPVFYCYCYPYRIGANTK